MAKEKAVETVTLAIQNIEMADMQEMIADNLDAGVSIFDLPPIKVPAGEVTLKPEPWATQEKEFSKAEEDAYKAGFTAACQYPHAAAAKPFWEKYKGKKS